jgi:hypothetical protein
MTYELVFNGVSAGPTEPYVLTALTGVGQTTRRAGRVPNARGGNYAGGVDVSEAREIVAEISISDTDPATAEAYADELVAAWAPAATDLELTVTAASGPRLYRGRPASVDIDETLLYAGVIRARCIFEALDPLWYSGVEKSVTVATLVETGGVVTPLVTPLVTTSSGSTGDASVVNEGTTSARWTVRLVGPLTQPRLILNGVTILIDGEVPAGETALVDSATRTVTMTSQVRHWVSYVSTWWDIPPGTSTFSLRATAGTGTATLVWRDANY